MAIIDKKVAVGDYTNQDIASLPNKPSSAGYTAEQLKARFDKLTKDVVSPKYNALIDELVSEYGAGNIGVETILNMTATDIQSALEELDARVNVVENEPGAETYVHIQGVATDTWIIEHNLNRYPSITVVDNYEQIVEGDIVYDSANQITITFNGGFSGKAYIN